MKVLDFNGDVTEFATKLNTNGPFAFSEKWAKSYEIQNYTSFLTQNSPFLTQNSPFLNPKFMTFDTDTSCCSRSTPTSTPWRRRRST